MHIYTDNNNNNNNLRKNFFSLNTCALTLYTFPIDKKQACNKGWAFERVKGFEMKKYSKKSVKLMTREECMQMCLNENDFECRSVNYDYETNECSLSDMDRHTIIYNTPKSKEYGPSSGSVDYMENNCIQGLYLSAKLSYN